MTIVLVRNELANVKISVLLLLKVYIYFIHQFLTFPRCKQGYYCNLCISTSITPDPIYEHLLYSMQCLKSRCVYLIKDFWRKNCPISLNPDLAQKIWTKSSKSISAAAPCWKKKESMKNDIFPMCTYTQWHRKIKWAFTQFTHCNFIYKLLRCQLHWVQPNRTYHVSPEDCSFKTLWENSLQKTNSILGIQKQDQGWGKKDSWRICNSCPAKPGTVIYLPIVMWEIGEKSLQTSK